MHYQVEGWLEDDLITTLALFLVSQDVGEKLQASGLTGYELALAKVTTSAQYKLMAKNRPRPALPKFCWLRVNGVAGQDDFGLSAEAMLVVSARGLEVLQLGRLAYCDIEPYVAETTLTAV